MLQDQPHRQRNHIFWLQREHFDFKGDGSWLERISFSLRAVYDVVAAPGWKLANYQRWNEIWLVKSGRVEVRLGDKQEIVEAGEIAILSTNQERSTSEIDGAPLSILGFSFDARVLETLDILPLLELPIRLRPTITARTELESRLEKAVAESRASQVGFSLATQSWTQIAFIETLRAALTSEEIGQRLHTGLHASLAPEIAEALAFIAENFDASLELHHLAKKAHLSPQHFARKFKNTTGLPPMEYVRHFRLAKAHALLAGSDRPVGDIAIDCGFTEAAYFSRAFKEHYGLSPFELRKQTRAFSPKTR